VPSLTVEFGYYPGLSFDPFAAVTLLGSWDAAGLASDGPWSSQPMSRVPATDGSVGYGATVTLDESAVGQVIRWGVQVERVDGVAIWGIPAEVDDTRSQAQYRSFLLQAPLETPQRQTYRLSWHRARGAVKRDGTDQIEFNVWAPNAQMVEVAFGGASGYIADDGYGADPQRPTLPMSLDPDGLWRTTRPDFAAYVEVRYLYRVTRDDGSVHYATDMFSRQQCGTGDFDPAGSHFDRTPAELDGRPSCSVVIDPAMVALYPKAVPDTTDADFWADENNPARPVPSRVQDLVIYELHIGALNPAVETAGTFADALELLAYLVDLGVNAIELMPMFEFDGSLSWGYGSSQFLAIESSSGGRDGLKQFVKACHQRGIAVLMDVVYNHYTGHADRAAWQYDGTSGPTNSYYWYEGTPSQYPDGSGGYLDNDSSGWAPRYSEERLRALFVSSAVMLADEFHIDGLRVDQTASIHSYNSLHADGSSVGRANIFGRKFLRELCETVKIVRPGHMLIAEDHSGWPEVTQPAAGGGIGFDATWYVDFYHHLIGENGRGPEWAKLLLSAGQDPDKALAIDYFAGALVTSADKKVVYESSHDEAGNDQGTERTILVAVNGAPLIGDTRRYAEARCRFACAMSMLSAGTPMFLMGEEVGAQKPYTYDKFSENKEDLEGLRATTGALLFRFYADIIRFRLGTPALRSSNIDIVHADNEARLIAFRRWDDRGELLVVGSLNNAPFNRPSYVLAHPALAGQGWQECFNSDSSRYGGDNVGNRGATIWPDGTNLGVIVPANGVVVLSRPG
jgi:1,4-alpha-glucan branching enzyme